MPSANARARAIIYLLQAYGLDRKPLTLYKIGTASDPYKRLRTLAAFSNDTKLPKDVAGFRMVAVWSTPIGVDAIKKEKTLHVILHKFNVWGEWFELPLEIVELLKLDSKELYEDTTLYDQLTNVSQQL